MGENTEGHFDIKRLMEVTAAYWASRALLTAHEIGMFAALDKGAASAEELAARLKCSQRGVTLLANALVGMGLLRKHQQHFSNGPFAAKHLVPGKGDDLTGYLGHHSNLWERWSGLTEAVCSGAAPPAEFPKDALRSFIMAMHAVGGYRAKRVVDRVGLTDVHHILDVGGGSGDYAYAFLQRAPQARAVIFDLPDVVPIAAECAELAGVADRVETVAGDYWKDELGEGFDLAIVSNILHSLAPDGCVSVLEKTWRALRPGGRVIVHDFVLNEDATRPAWAALFSLNMLTAGNRGRSYTHVEIQGFLLQAGFEAVEHIPMEAETDILIGRRPES